MKLFKIVNDWDQMWLVLADSIEGAAEEWQFDHNPYDLEGNGEYDISVHSVWRLKDAEYYREDASALPAVGVFIKRWRETEDEKKMIEENTNKMYVPSDDDIPF